jgi:hypothetical protein
MPVFRDAKTKPRLSGGLARDAARDAAIALIQAGIATRLILFGSAVSSAEVGDLDLAIEFSGSARIELNRLLRTGESDGELDEILDAALIDAPAFRRWIVAGGPTDLFTMQDGHVYHLSILYALGYLTCDHLAPAIERGSIFCGRTRTFQARWDAVPG